jgi:S-adenosylmethionine:tRNA ribosyltransferase-isomerase
MSAALAFELPESLEAHEPPESRGLARDCVRMLVASRATGDLLHAHFRDLPRFLAPGDLLVVNASATLPAAIPAQRRDWTQLTLHLSTPVPDSGGERWVVELRRGSAPFGEGLPGEILELPAGGRAELIAPYLSGARLWVAKLLLPEPFARYFARHGHPIRYRYVPDEQRLADYQTVFASAPGSAEMPSAGRPFTPELVAELVSVGVLIAPLVLHTGVSSLEDGESPYPEWYSVAAPTAGVVTAVRRWGGRVIAVGTTVVRALESAARPDGSVAPSDGWTRLVVTHESGVRVVDGLVTGWHEPGASHLQLLDAVGGRELVERSYREALSHGYLWHEFGDVHLILP